MADCELLETCIFFTDKMKDMPGTANLMKERYCKTHNADCARYMARNALGKDNVPSDLFPGDLMRAKKLLGL